MTSIRCTKICSKDMKITSKTEKGRHDLVELCRCHNLIFTNSTTRYEENYIENKTEIETLIVSSKTKHTKTNASTSVVSTALQTMIHSL